MESQGALSQVGVDGAPQLGRLQEQREESQHGLVGWTDREQLRDREREREREREITHENYRRSFYCRATLQLPPVQSVRSRLSASLSALN